MDYDPDLLRTFIAVKETGGFTRAGERLHLSQSAVSHQIRRLEEQAGTPLLTRTTRSLSLTEDGEDFLRHAEQVLRAQDALARRFQRSSVGGTVRFGVPESYVGDRLPPMLARYSRMFPSVRLDVTVDTYLALRDQIDAGALDLAVILALEDDPASVLLRHTRFVWAAATTFDPAAQTPMPFAFAPMPCLHREVATRALEEAKLDWRAVFTSHSQQGLRAAVRAGLAMTAMPQEDLEPGMVVIDDRYGLPPLPQAGFRLLWSASGKTPAAQALAMQLIESGEAIPAAAGHAETRPSSS